MFELTDQTLNMGFGIVTASHRKKILETIEAVRPDHIPQSAQNAPQPTPVHISYVNPNGRRVSLQSRNIYAFDMEDPRVSQRRNPYRRRSLVAHDDEPCPIYIFVCLTCFFSPVCGFVGLCAFARANNNPNYPNKAQAYKFLLLSTFLSLILW